MKGYKTLVFNGIMAIIAIVHALNTDAALPGADAVQGLVDQFSTWFDGAVLVGNIILRAVTTTPILKKE